MRTRLMFVIVLVVAAIGVGLGGQMLSARGHHYVQSTPTPGGAMVSDSELVESLKYEHLFRSLIAAPDAAADVKAKAGMTDEEMLVLQSLATECLAEIAKVDVRANALIDEFRVKAEKSKRLKDMPPPPPELRGLQQQRNAIALRYREKLRTSLGEERFLSVNEFAKSTIKIELIKPLAKTQG